MDGDIVFLDLNKVRLFGFERETLASKVDRMIKSIEAGDEDFPPVPVKKFNKSTYALTHQPDSTGKADGGHHRAVAHYIANKPLKCMLVEGKYKWKGFPRTDEYRRLLFSIPEAILVDKLPTMPKDRYVAFMIYCSDE